MNLFKHFKKELIFGLPVLIIFGLLLALQTQLPFFTKFLPVGENKLVILILNINILLILLLLFLVSRILLKNYIEKKRGIWGSGLKTKLTVTLLLISILPSFSLFILTTGFFYQAMDTWFGQKIEDTVDDALQLSQFYYEELFQRYEQSSQSLSKEISKGQIFLNDRELASFLEKTVRSNVVGYLAVFDLNGAVIRQSGKLPSDGQKKLGMRARPFTKGETIRAIIPLEAGELIAVGTQIRDSSGDVQAILFAGSVTKLQGIEKIKDIAISYKEFKESRPFKKILKYSFVIPLSLVTILTIFFSVWVGMKMATEITVPIEKVREGASIIASGKLDINLEDRGTDEINTLVQAFNSMARELKVAKDEIEERRRYMEVILENVATGIISTDKTGKIVLMNKAAGRILGVPEDGEGKYLKDIFGDDFRKHLRPFLKEAKESPGGSVSREIRLGLTKDVMNIRASLTTLRDDGGRTEGFIITFDDITNAVRAEKLSAWRDAAKKLTHEIKNPLTPILLSAERLRRRLLDKFRDRDRDVLDETTTVIIRSVDDIKGIVNELTRFTHVSSMRTEEDLNTIAEEAAGLYMNLYQNIIFRLEKGDLPLCYVDRDGIKRTLTNLITNAVKAIDPGTGGSITITTRHDRDREVVIVEVADTGKGIPDTEKESIFDPYFTKERDGTGLGLAIVHSIILEHQGTVSVVDNRPRGTRFIIELPITEEEA